MIQAIGLTSTSRRHRRPAVDDLTFEARPGKITVLLGPAGSGKSEALRLMLQILPGRGVALFRGRPVHRIPHPAREIGVLLGDVPGHPARTARSHLRMLTAVAGVPVSRADDVLDVVGLSGLAGQRLGDFSLGMDRRLGMAAALLGDPHTLVLDEPAHGLSPREASWLHGLLRGYADQGGLVLTTSRDPKEAARLADRVISVEHGRLVADQEAPDFTRTRLRRRVAVRTPHADRLAAVLSQEARSAGHPERSTRAVEVVRDGGSRVSVYGSTCAEVGESAYRHGILVHQLAEEVGDAGDVRRPGPLARADGRTSERPRVTTGSFPAPALPQPKPSGSAPTNAQPAVPAMAMISERTSGATGGDSGECRGSGAGAGIDSASCSGPEQEQEQEQEQEVSVQAEEREPRTLDSPHDRRAPHPALPPPLPAVPRPGPVSPVRYELRRLFGVRTTWIVMVAAVLTALAISVVLARTSAATTPVSGEGMAHALRLLTGWPPGAPFFLPPAAVAAGLLGALAFGQEFRFPALAPARAPVPRRLGLLLAKLLVSAGTSVALCLVTAVLNIAVLTLLFGADSGVLSLPAPAPDLAPAPDSALSGAPAVSGVESSVAQSVAVLSVCVGCAWAGLLAAGVFRSSILGAAAVVAVPLLVAPAVRTLLSGPGARSLEGLPERLRTWLLVPWPSAVDHWITVGMRLASQPVGRALTLSLTVLLCAYALTSLRGRPR